MADHRLCSGICGLALVLVALPGVAWAQSAPAQSPDSRPDSAPTDKKEEMLPPPVIPSDQAPQQTAPPEVPITPPITLSPLMSPVGYVPYRADYRVTWFATEPVKGQPQDLGYTEQDFSLVFPLWQSCANEFSGTVHVRGELFNTNAILPDTRQPFPEDLWNIRFGTTYRHLFDNGWVTGGTVNFGSASD